jgi:pimeloyl-ACP methyl ester carboxylesterase
MPHLAELDVAIPDGRIVRTASLGPENGFPVVWHHGNPGSRVPPLAEPVLESAGIRLITYDRPGAGHSTARPGRRVADVRDDVSAIADAWEIARFGTAGISAGGAHTLGTAALLPDRVVAAAVLSGAAPIDAEGLDFTAGMSQTNTQAAEDQEEVDREAALLEGAPMRQAILADPERALLGFAEEFPLSDREALELREVVTPIAEGMAECVRESAEGWLDDSIAFARPWGFDVATIEVPVGIWQGREDTATPITHARWLTARIPQAELYELEGGHYAPYLRLPEILRWLAEHD